MSNVHIVIAYRLASPYTGCLYVICHFVEYYLETKFVIDLEGRSEKVGSVLNEIQ